MEEEWREKKETDRAGERRVREERKQCKIIMKNGEMWGKERQEKESMGGMRENIEARRRH